MGGHCEQELAPTVVLEVLAAPITGESMGVRAGALTELQARYQFSRAVATDAGRNVMRDADGKIERDKYGRAVMGASMAIVAHNGSVTSGHMYEPEATDNYAGELGAVLVALKEAPADGRMLVVVDATSPVTAWLRFRGVHDRIKCG